MDAEEEDKDEAEAKPGIRKEDLHMMYASSAVSMDIGSVIVTKIQHPLQKTSQTESGWGLSERNGPLLTSQTNL